MRDKAYQVVLEEKRELKAMFDREIAARRVAQDGESAVAIRLEDAKERSEDEKELVGSLHGEIAVLQRRLDSANLRSQDQTRQNQDLLEQLAIEQEAHTATRDQLAVAQEELEATQVLYRAAQVGGGGQPTIRRRQAGSRPRLVTGVVAAALCSLAGIVGRRRGEMRLVL